MLEKWKFVISKVCFIPQRYILGIMGFLGVVNAYTMRVVLSVAITEMVPMKQNEHIDAETCRMNPMDNSTSHRIVGVPSSNLYAWTSEQQGLILSAFYWGYVITHIPGGMIAERFGGKYSCGLGMLCTAILTFVTPLVIHATGGDWRWVVVLRVLEGLGEGTTFPALTTMLSSWVPLRERSIIGTLVYAGSQIGTIVGNSVSGALISATNDWAIAFYFFGAMGIVWFIFWTLMCYQTPSKHPFICEKEKQFLEKEIVTIAKKEKVIPWRAILTSAPIWALVIAQCGHDWAFFAMVTDLPKYMKEVLHFNVKENGLWSSLPYVVMWIVSLSSSYLCDWIIHKNYMGISTARKFFTTVACFGPAVFLVAAAYSGCDRMLAVAMFTIAMGFMGNFYCGMKVNVLDLSPNYCGTIMAIVNGIGAFTGIIVPYLIGAITTNHTLAEWKLVFWITFAVLCATNLAFIFMGSGEIQPWDNTLTSTSQSNGENVSEKSSGKVEMSTTNGNPNFVLVK